MTLQDINELPREQALALFHDCCAAQVWAEAMTDRRPYASTEALHAAARELWPTLTEADWLAAFEAHPKIGDMQSLKARYASTAALASGEQSGAREASEDVLVRLQAGNDAYQAKFGFIFIVCATGKSAEEMLALLESRLPNPRDTEMQIAAAEQAKISHIRLDKLL